MQNVTLIAIDPAKHSFHVHCQHGQGCALLRKKFSRTSAEEFSRLLPGGIQSAKEPTKNASAQLINRLLSGFSTTDN